MLRSWGLFWEIRLRPFPYPIAKHGGSRSCAGDSSRSCTETSVGERQDVGRSPCGWLGAGVILDEFQRLVEMADDFGDATGSC
jgi:hypothetical protein